MTGGLAYLMKILALVNPEIVKPQRASSPAGVQQPQELIQAHAERTGSTKGENTH